MESAFMTSRRFPYSLGTISQAPNWRREDGKIVCYEPYVREMRVWARLFEHVDVFAPLSTDKISVTVSEYGFDNISFQLISYSHTIAWWGAIARLWQLPITLIKLTTFIWQHEILLIRSPSHLGLYAHLIVKVLRRKTITKFAGYFGPFQGERMPSIVERYILTNWLRPPNYVLVYGAADEPHLVSFIPAAISTEEIRQLRTLARREAPGKGSKIFYSLGKLIPVKNYELAIHAFGLLRKEHPGLDWRYHVIGDGAQLEFFKQLVQDYGIEDRVVFEGKLSYHDSLQHIAAGDFVIMPGTKEGWPKVVIESWAVGAVPLVANSGIMPNVIRQGENGILFEPTAIALAEKLRAVLEGEFRLDSMRRVGFDEALNYTIETFESRVEELCEDKLGLKL